MFKLILLFFSVLNLFATEEITLHLTSWHSIEKEEGSWNPHNYGLSYKTNEGLKIGAFQNSNYRTTVYFGYEQNINTVCGYLIGVGTGYEIPIGGSLWCAYQNLRLDLLPVFFKHSKKNGVAIGVSLVF